MNLDQLRGFVEIADTGHFTRAAERLHLAQPSLSRQVSGLEADLGVELFHRIRGNVHLTHAGERLLPFARRILADVSAARDDMAALTGLRRGRLRLGATPTLCTSIVAEVLAEFRERYPGIEIEIVERGSRTLISALMDGELDLALIVTSVTSGAARAVLEREPILTERLVAVSSARMPDPFAAAANGAASGEATGQAGREAYGSPDAAEGSADGSEGSPGTGSDATGPAEPRAVTLAELATVPLVAFPENYDVRAALDSAFRAESLTPVFAVEGAEMDAAIRFAERGVGVAVVPAMVAVDRPRLRTTPLADPALSRTISVARRADMAPTHASAAMQALIRDVADRLAAPESEFGELLVRVGKESRVPDQAAR